PGAPAASPRPSRPGRPGRRRHAALAGAVRGPVAPCHPVRQSARGLLARPAAAAGCGAGACCYKLPGHRMAGRPARVPLAPALPADRGRTAPGAARRGGGMSERDIDAELVARVQRGDKKAFDLLVLKYQRKILRLLGRMIRDPAEVEDVAQEAFIKAYRALPQFRGESAFYTWLYRIAVNTARNWLASAGRRPSAPNAIETEDGETFNETDNLTDISTPEAVLASREIAQTVNAVIEELPEELRTAIVLREIEGMSYEDIAQSMDCPIGTVRSRIFRAREAIASRLRPLLDTDAERRW